MLPLNSCKENATEKINQDNVEKAAERDAQTIVFPTINFDKTSHDFGEIQNGTAVETVFSYTNSGRSPLVVTDIKSTCGCTVPQGWSKEPLMPGESSQFSVKFNGKGANKVSKTITLTTNTEKGREQVRITAFVKPDPNAPAPAVVKKQ
jgi:hypothetical protein